jgi:hypothetical protein
MRSGEAFDTAKLFSKKHLLKADWEQSIYRF